MVGKDERSLPAGAVQKLSIGAELGRRGDGGVLPDALFNLDGDRDLRPARRCQVRARHDQSRLPDHDLYGDDHSMIKNARSIGWSWFTAGLTALILGAGGQVLAAD